MSKFEKPWPHDSCDECGSELVIHTSCIEGELVYDGDKAWCPECHKFVGSVVVEDAGDNELAHAWVNQFLPMSTEKEPDCKGIAERLADKAHPVWKYRDMDKYNAAARKGYASCMEARLRSDWETIRLLKAQTYHHDNCGYWTEVVSLDDKRYCGECTCGLSAHLSKLLEPFT